jgi:hypothetical protein
VDFLRHSRKRSTCTCRRQFRPSPTSLGRPLGTLTPRELTSTLLLVPQTSLSLPSITPPLVRIVRIPVGLVPHACVQLSQSLTDVAPISCLSTEAVGSAKYQCRLTSGNRSFTACLPRSPVVRLPALRVAAVHSTSLRIGVGACGLNCLKQ